MLIELHVEEGGQDLRRWSANATSVSVLRSAVDYRVTCCLSRQQPPKGHGVCGAWARMLLEFLSLRLVYVS